MRTLLVPEIVSYYFARSSLTSFWKNNWDNGVWAIMPFLFTDVIPVSWRHLVPLLFVTSLVGSAIMGVAVSSFLWVFLGIAGAYGCVSVATSSHIAWRQRDPKYLVVMPLVFMVLHVGYGLGSLWGIFKILGRPEFWKKLSGVRGTGRKTATR